jgi:hypothetical protein
MTLFWIGIFIFIYACLTYVSYGIFFAIFQRKEESVPMRIAYYDVHDSEALHAGVMWPIFLPTYIYRRLFKNAKNYGILFPSKKARLEAGFDH